MAKSFIVAMQSGHIPLKYMESKASVTLKQYMEFKEDQSPNQYMLAPFTTLVPEKWKEEFDKAVDRYTSKFSPEDEDYATDSYAAETEMPFKNNRNPVVETAPTKKKAVVETGPTKKNSVSKKRQATTATSTEQELIGRAFVLERKRRVQQFTENMRAELRDF
jgi:hypothetical protein